MSANEALRQWQPIETAPKHLDLLLFGEQKPGSVNCGVFYADPMIFVGYWDEIDGAWCATGTTWLGPFFNATHWMHLPEKP